MGFFRTTSRNSSAPSAPVRPDWLTSDQESLRQAFYDSYDRSVIESLVYPTARGLDRHERAHPIGEGRHFRAVVLQPQLPHQIPLVLSQPKPSFLGLDPQRTSQRWIESMRSLKQQRLPLIPPFEIVVIDNIVRCFITPFGSGGSDQIKMRWQPLNDYVNLTLQGLRRIRLEIDDYIQIRTFDGIPFICDFSDLKSLINS